jgi:hypothetical protein
MLLCVLLGLMLSVLHLEDQFSNRRDPYAACNQQILLAAFRGPQSLDQSAAPRRLDANALPIFRVLPCLGRAPVSVAEFLCTSS